VKDEYYGNSFYKSNIGKKEKGNNKYNKEYVKKKDKHWKNNGKNNKRGDHIENIMDDNELLKIQNLIKCNTCENIYHISLKKCSYCKPNL
jgi:hypothetical protein